MLASSSAIDSFHEHKLDHLKPILETTPFGPIVRVGGRNRDARLKVLGELPPIFLHYQEHLSTLLVTEAHHQAHHQGDQTLQATLRHKYWIPRTLVLAKKIRTACFFCKLVNKNYEQQQMSDVLEFRTTPAPPWHTVSIDLFGPMTHVRGRSSVKAWGLLFACTRSGAVHLELTDDYSTGSILVALQKFQAIRGTPTKIISDQGTQMVAAAKFMNNSSWDPQVINYIRNPENWNDIKVWASSSGTTWELVPTKAHHFNGLAESMIKSTKKHLATALSGKRLSFAQLSAILYKVANIVNSRPLGTNTGTDPSDAQVLTPNHLLLGRASCDVAPSVQGDTTLLGQAKVVQDTTLAWWSLWLRNVFHQLSPSYKWHRKFRQPQIGDVVICNDSNDVASLYKLARIIDTVPSRTDGLTRSVVLEYPAKRDDPRASGFKTTARPIQNVCVIVPVNEDPSQHQTPVDITDESDEEDEDDTPLAQRLQQRQNHQDSLLLQDILHDDEFSTRERRRPRRYSEEY